MGADRSTKQAPHGSPYAVIDTGLGLLVVAAFLLAAWSCWRWATELVTWWMA